MQLEKRRRAKHKGQGGQARVYVFSTVESALSIRLIATLTSHPAAQPITTRTVFPFQQICRGSYRAYQACVLGRIE
jgi:hypothetical protein